jgi:hypothetical protein
VSREVGKLDGSFSHLVELMAAHSCWGREMKKSESSLSPSEEAPLFRLHRHDLRSLVQRCV